MDKSKWEYKKLGEVATFERGLTYSKADEGNNTNVFVLRSNNIDLNNYTLDFKDLKELRNNFIIPENKKLKKGSIFICMSNGSKDHLGKVAYVNQDYDYAFGGFMGLIRPYNFVFPKFLYYALRSLNFKEFLSSIGNGANIRNLKFSDLSNYKIFLPSINTQHRIVSELDQLSAIISLKQQQMKEYDALAQSLFYEMFGDPKINEKGWDTDILKNIATIKIGPFGSLLHNSDYITGGTPLVNPVHMDHGRIKVDNDFTIDDNKKKELSSYLLKTNDIIFGRRGDIGRCALVTEKENNFICGTGSLFVRFNIEINPIYSLCVLSEKSTRDYLLSQAKGATMLNINCKIVESIPIPLPPLFLQHSFAEKVKAIEHQKSLLKQSIAETQTLLDSRMQEYFG